MFWAIGILLGAPFAVYTAFLALCTARSALDAGIAFPPGMLLVARFWLVVGWPADVLFNWTWGAWMFREWRGLTFSSHIQWRVDNGRWDDQTQLWTAFLNAGMKNHIKRVPT